MLMPIHHQKPAVSSMQARCNLQLLQHDPPCK